MYICIYIYIYVYIYWESCELYTTKKQNQMIIYVNLYVSMKYKISHHCNIQTTLIYFQKTFPQCRTEPNGLRNHKDFLRENKLTGCSVTLMLMKLGNLFVYLKK